MKTQRKENLENKKQGQMLTGMFSDRESSEGAYQTLHDLGYSSDDINIIMSDETRKRYFLDDDSEAETETEVVQNEENDFDTDYGIGTIGGIVAALETGLKIPGEGILIAGPIVSKLARSGIVTRGIFGLMVDSGITEERAKLYESGIRKGQIVIGVYTRSEEDAEDIESSWDSYNGQEIHR